MQWTKLELVLDETATRSYARMPAAASLALASELAVEVRQAPAERAAVVEWR